MICNRQIEAAAGTAEALGQRQMPFQEDSECMRSVIVATGIFRQQLLARPTGSQRPLTCTAGSGSAAGRSTAVDHTGQRAILSVCCSGPKLAKGCCGWRHAVCTGNVAGVLLDIDCSWQGSSNAQSYGRRCVGSSSAHTAQTHSILAARGCRSTRHDFCHDSKELASLQMTQRRVMTAVSTAGW